MTPQEYSSYNFQLSWVLALHHKTITPLELKKKDEKGNYKNSCMIAHKVMFV